MKMEKEIALKKLIEDFVAFRDLCIIIRRNYNTHHDLFLSGENKLLDKVACTFFSDLNSIMVKYWIMQVCAIMDPAETKLKKRKYENITIALIDKQLQNEGLATKEIDRLSKELKKYGEKLKPARNKRIVHNDRDHWFNDITLGATPKEELDAFLKNLQEYCDEVGRAIGIGPSDFSSSACEGDVHDLLRVLRKYHK